MQGTSGQVSLHEETHPGEHVNGDLSQMWSLDSATRELYSYVIISQS